MKCDGENDLRKNIQTVLRRLRRLDVFFDDGVPYGDGLQKLMRMRGEQEGAAGRADLMARTADPLRRGRDGGWRVDENDFVDGADVDAEFERRRGDDGLQLSCLHAFFDGLADFLRQ